jgi:sugar phosphate isomerase/epimerase
MRLGISSYTYTWAVGVPGHPPPRPLTANALLDKAAQLGVSVVQFADNLPLHELTPSHLATLEKYATKLELSVEVGTRGIARDHLRTYLTLAQRFKSPIVRIVIDTADRHPDPEEVVRALRDVVPEFERADVCIAVENHDRFPAKVLAEIIRRVESDHVGVCLDTVNSFGALEGPEVVLGTLGPHVVNLHIKDFAVYRASHTMGFSIEGRPTGQGRLNVPWLLQALRDWGRDPNAILELWTPPENELKATIRKEEVWAAQSVEYLRTLIPG